MMKKFLSCVLICFLAVLCMVNTCIAESAVDLGSFKKSQLENIKKDAEQAIADFHTVSSKTQSAIEKNVKKAVE